MARAEAGIDPEGMAVMSRRPFKVRGAGTARP